MIETLILAALCGFAAGLLSYTIANSGSMRFFKVNPNVNVRIFKNNDGTFSVTVKSKKSEIFILGNKLGVESLSYGKE